VRPQTATTVAPSIAAAASACVWLMLPAPISPIFTAWTPDSDARDRSAKTFAFA
jgi:hypothetical protein